MVSGVGVGVIEHVGSLDLVNWQGKGAKKRELYICCHHKEETKTSYPQAGRRKC